MSRVAGIYEWGGETAKVAVSDLLLAQQNNGWGHKVSALGRVEVGWCGQGQAQLFGDEQLRVVMDGFIYNRASYSLVLTPAQLVAKLFRERGPGALASALNGDFAIAVFDLSADELHLIRDRFGVRPLYYAQTDTGWVFGSRLRAVLAHPGVARELNRSFVARYAGLHYRYIDADLTRTPYEHIRQVPPATVVTLRRQGAAQRVYWQLAEQPDWDSSEIELAGRMRQLLRDAVAVRLGEAKRPAFTLSSGLDSSSVLATAVELTDRQVEAFSSVYTDKTFDESVGVRPMLALVSRWHQVKVDKPDVLAVVSEMIAVNDEPVATATWLPHFEVCREVRAQGFSSLFGGLGGDELNAGEYEYFFYFFADLIAADKKPTFNYEVERWAHYHDHPVWRKDKRIAEAALRRLIDRRLVGRCLVDRERLGRYGLVLNREFFETRFFEPLMEHPFGSYLKNRAYQDLSLETTPCCLRVNDRQTVAAGLDSFLPWLDYRLVEFMWRVPGEMKIRAGVTKYLLREAMRGVLPEETRKRVKKMGWNAPAHRWFAGKGRELLADIINSSRWRQRGIYDVAEVERIVDEHDKIVSSGLIRENHMMFLWQLVNLEVWLRVVEEPAEQPRETKRLGRPEKVKYI